MQHAANRWFED